MNPQGMHCGSGQGSIRLMPEMAVSIMLLDCSEALRKELEARGYDVSAGTTGYCTGVRSLPRPIYECDVLVYNPTTQNPKVPIKEEAIADKTPVISFSQDTLAKHISSGGHWLVFANKVSEDPARQGFAYLPFVPGVRDMAFTQDTKTSMSKGLGDLRHMDKYLPVFRAPKVLPIKLPVLVKLDSSHDNFTTILENARGEALAGLFWWQFGEVLFLPTLENNDNAVLFYMTHIFPKFKHSATPKTLEDEFISPAEADLRAKDDELFVQYGMLEDFYNENKKKLFEATQEKLKLIAADETARWAIECYKEAQEDPARAAGPLFKVLEAIGNKYGNDTAAKLILVDCNAEWNTLKELTNRSDKNARHLPKPGEVVKPLTEDEIRRCFDAAKKMILAYLRALFAGPAPAPPAPSSPTSSP